MASKHFPDPNLKLEALTKSKALAAPPSPPPPAVPQPPPQPTNVVYKTEVDYDFYLLNQFLNGMRATVFAPNCMRCSAKLQVFLNQVNATEQGYKVAPKNSTPDTYIFNMTKVISSSGASATGECYTTGYSLQQYFLMKKKQFGTMNLFMTSFLQNMIGNILNFNTIYNNILAADKSGNMGAVYFYYGRLVYLLIYFNPIEMEALDRLEQSSSPPVPQGVQQAQVILHNSMSFSQGFLAYSIGV